MKRFLLIPSFAFVALSTLTSCQKEDKTALELTRELTAELQKVTDYRTAEAAAPRVEVLNKRMQNASVRPFALNETALTRSAAADAEGSEGAAYAEALAQLAAEIGRIQASTPVATAEGEIDRDKLVLAVGAANGSAVSASAAERKKAGLKYIHDTTGTHTTPGNFAEFYGSDKLRDALDYKADASAVPMTKMDSEEDVPAIPASEDVPEEEIPSDDAVADEEPTAADEEPAADDSSSEEPAADDSEEPAADDSEEPSLDDSEEPAADDSSSEEPAADDSSDISLDTEDSGSDDSESGEMDIEDTGDSEDAGDISLDLDL